MPQGLTSKGAATRQRIIDGAAVLMRQSGGGVSLDEIREATSTSKSQLFHYFPDGREQLVLAVASHEADQILADQQPYLDDLTSWRSWHAWRNTVVAHYKRQGRQCPLRVLLGQLDPEDTGGQSVQARLMDSWHGKLAAGVRHMQDQDLMTRGLAADRAADVLLAAVQGGAVVLIVTGSTGSLEAAVDLTLDQLRVHP
ncbi:TetR/AcrR family transcriptional regulator [Actinacidiphila sp. ITFR-21]|uniref:TetR/AcrR family transcriptional regulator n=1 Tax=Actinacidiphila sp. ITFR-21 TaxID=3075199 RepID=UPI002889D1C7|nr:TetR/AcrR family transcriptional regulator [Streptomyces sp. ITFR-21]WNI14501.1 TetR/AcrR family transcriptional regulator [Streptomyces sp. ITFR-21]